MIPVALAEGMRMSREALGEVWPMAKLTGAGNKNTLLSITGCIEG